MNHLTATSKPKRVAAFACEEFDDGTFLGELAYRKCMKGSKIAPSKLEALRELKSDPGQ